MGEKLLRVEKHPVLGDAKQKESWISITIDGRKIKAREGEPIASALIASGSRVFRYTLKKDKPRGLFCAIGRCNDCLMIVDGKANVRTCITPVRDGMIVETQKGDGKSNGKKC